MNARKKLRLADYDYSQPGAYFITVCTKEKRCILGTVRVGADDHIGPYTKLSPVGEIVEQYTATIPGVAEYCVMPNHVHFILHISSDNILQGPMWSSAPTGTSVEKTVRTWKTLISKKLGQSIFQRSYYDHIIRSDEDHIKIQKYIRENPAKWCDDRYYDSNM